MLLIVSKSAITSKLAPIRLLIQWFFLWNNKKQLNNTCTQKSIHYSGVLVQDYNEMNQTWQVLAPIKHNMFAVLSDIFRHIRRRKAVCSSISISYWGRWCATRNKFSTSSLHLYLFSLSRTAENRYGIRGSNLCGYYGDCMVKL